MFEAAAPATTIIVNVYGICEKRRQKWCRRSNKIYIKNSDIVAHSQRTRKFSNVWNFDPIMKKFFIAKFSYFFLTTSVSRKSTGCCKLVLNFPWRERWFLFGSSWMLWENTQKFVADSRIVLIIKSLSNDVIILIYDFSVPKRSDFLQSLFAFWAIT